MNEPSQTSLEQMLAKIASYRDQVCVAESFALKFGPLLPSGVASMSLDLYSEVGKPQCLMRTGWTAEDRTKALSLAGEVFGPRGWVKQINHDKTFWNWAREIDGVSVTIYQAEQIPDHQENQPVPPSAFPLLLTKSETEGAEEILAEPQDWADQPPPEEHENEFSVHPEVVKARHQAEQSREEAFFERRGE